jgi:hypothetical protein
MDALRLLNDTEKAFFLKVQGRERNRVFKGLVPTGNDFGLNSEYLKKLQIGYENDDPLYMCLLSLPKIRNAMGATKRNRYATYADEPNEELAWKLPLYKAILNLLKELNA